MYLNDVIGNQKFIEQLIKISKNDDVIFNASKNSDSIVLEVVCNNLSADKKASLLDKISKSIIENYEQVSVSQCALKKSSIVIEYTGEYVER